MTGTPRFTLALAGTALVALAGALAGAPRAEARTEAQGAGSSRPLEVTPRQARAVERGLDWLTGHQQADGSWKAKIGYKLNDDYNYTAERGHVG
ncbi:MAG: hypothetical protein QF410_14860, partial [Planctomycetota bacterium]|nr:hypothetical protein [Planctomycetota bacterium]